MNATQPINLDELGRDALQALQAELELRYQQYSRANVSSDVTRGKPSIEQLELSAALDGILGGDYRATDGSDTRGYGGRGR